MKTRAGRRKAIVAVALALVGIAAGLWLLFPTQPPERVVLIVIDTLRRDALSPYAGKVPTPHIQALADRGQVFTNVLSSFHQTSMSMGALFAGRTPSLEARTTGESLAWTGSSWCGFARLATPGTAQSCVPEALDTLAERMRDAGYWTIGVTSNELLYEPAGYAAGFYEWLEVKRSRSGSDRDAKPMVRWPQVNQAALAALERRPHDRFFLYVHYMDVHNYFLDDEPYATGVHRADEAVGDLMETLKKGGLLEGTTVILTSDHGESLPENRTLGRPGRHLGNPSFQEVLRIPLLVAPPAAGNPDRFLRSEDIHHLVLDIAGVDSENTAELDPEELFLSELQFRTHIQGRWKLMEERNGKQLRLFNLEDDPGEQRDLASTHPEKVAKQRRRMDELSARLAGDGSSDALSAEDRRRLQVLGYLDE